VTVAITTGGLATSGTAARRWQRGGRQFHHLIDPATGAPAAPCWRTVTVAARTCLSANVASTASVILGAAAPAWLAQRGLHARLVTEDGAVVATGDWPESALEPHPSDPSETVPC
jgi:thiamine biosynthesis lipoprotein